MSSATRPDPNAFGKVMSANDPIAKANIARLGLSPRQLELNRRWSYYCCAQYENRKTEWDGSAHLDLLAKEAIVTAGFIPPGFYAADGAMTELPLRFRRPTIPYHLGKVIVNRFTGLLFSEHQHPMFTCPGDPETEDFANALAEAARLWPSMIQSRNFGGGTGTAVVGYAFIEGKPVIEVFDPRWTRPIFKDRMKRVVQSVEIRFMYPVEEQDDRGIWEEVSYWYRRTIDEQSDIVFKPVEVAQDGSEPRWEVDLQVTHGLGECPVVWVQNLPVSDDMDGEADCHGVFEMLEGIDTLLSQSHRGTIANCDPTLVLEDVGESAPSQGLKKGSGSAITLPKGTAKYLEIVGSGPAAALTLAKDLRGFVLEVSQCVLDHPADAATKTATEIERVYSSMIAKADILREQYGQGCVLPLIRKMISAASKLGQTRPVASTDGTTKLVRYSLNLPPKVSEDGKLVARKLGDTGGSTLTLSWPGYFKSSIADAAAASTAASTAKMGGLIDAEHATKFIAPFFDVQDPRAMLEKMSTEAAAAADKLNSDLLGSMPGVDASTKPGAGADDKTADQPDSTNLDGDKHGKGAELKASEGVQPGEVKFFSYEIEGGIVTINEVRASKGLAPKADGDLTVPEYRAKYAEMISRATAAMSPAVGTALLQEEFGVSDATEMPAPVPSTAPPPAQAKPSFPPKK